MLVVRQKRAYGELRGRVGAERCIGGRAMEDAEKEPQEALSAIGAGKGSILVGAILPDIMPSLINSSLFALEKAVRSSVVLGLVGAGGIGQELNGRLYTSDAPDDEASVDVC